MLLDTDVHGLIKIYYGGWGVPHSVYSNSLGTEVGVKLPLSVEVFEEVYIDIGIPHNSTPE